uniref:(northern house mosquito) hypothetical protein n=1 Tax=Culex pipiens TaxID=7175 RepID=A0A8D8EWV1_CULPI
MHFPAFKIKFSIFEIDQLHRKVQSSAERPAGGKRPAAQSACQVRQLWWKPHGEFPWLCRAEKVPRGAGQKEESASVPPTSEDFELDRCSSWRRSGSIDQPSVPSRLGRFVR